MFQRNGIWQFRPMIHGKRRLFTTGQRDKALAMVVVTKYQADIDRDAVDVLIGRKDRSTVPTYAEFVETYVAEVVSGKRFAGAADNARVQFRKSLAFFGNTRLDKIDAARCDAFMRHIDTLRTSKDQPYRPNYKINFISASRMLFNEAVRRKILPASPWNNTTKTLRPRGTHRSRVISLTEQRDVLAVMNPETARAFVVLLGTGLRESELLLLEARHCDFVTGTLNLSGDIVKGKSRFTAQEIKRAIPMQPAVRRALQEQLTARGAGLGDGDNRAVGGRLWNVHAHTLSQWFKASRKAAGVTDFTEHDCRRTFGTRCAEAGVKPHQLQSWMGHSNIGTTMDFYVHEQRAESHDAMKRMDLGLD